MADSVEEEESGTQKPSWGENFRCNETVGEQVMRTPLDVNNEFTQGIIQAETGEPIEEENNLYQF